MIVPMYAVETYLPDTLASLQNQTFDDLQIVLVDDGSPDRVGEIASRAAALDSRVTYVRQDNRGPGPGGGRNGGLEAAVGDYVMFVDADDVIRRHGIELMMDLARSSRADLVTCNAARLVGGAVHHSEFHDLGHRCDVASTTAIVSPWLMFDSTPWNKIFRRDYFDHVVGRWPEQILYEDIAVMTRAHLRSEATAVISEPLYYWRVRDSGQITQQTAAIKGDLEQLRELRKGAEEVARWGDAATLDWYSWKAYGFDLTWMTRKLARITPEDASELAGEMRLTMDQLSERAFAQLPARTRDALAAIDRVDRPLRRARAAATNWRLTPVSRGFDVGGRDPHADLLRWNAGDECVELVVGVDSSATGSWQLQLSKDPILTMPDRELVAAVAGKRGRSTRAGRDVISFRLPEDLDMQANSAGVLHLAVATEGTGWRGEVGRSFGDRVASRIGRQRASAQSASSIAPFFENNRLKLAVIDEGKGALSVSAEHGRLTITVDGETALSMSELALYSERQHEPFELVRGRDVAAWSIELETVGGAMAQGHNLLALAYTETESPTIPVPLRGQPSVENHVEGIDVFLGAHGQVFLRPARTALAQATEVLDYLRRRSRDGA